MIIKFTIVSYPALSAIKPDYQAFVVYTPNFTPKSRKFECLYIFLTVQAGRKRNGFNISGSFRLHNLRLNHSFLPKPIYWVSQAYITLEPNQDNKGFNYEWLLKLGENGIKSIVPACILGGHKVSITRSLFHFSCHYL